MPSQSTAALLCAWKTNSLIPELVLINQKQSYFRPVWRRRTDNSPHFSLAAMQQWQWFFIHSSLWHSCEGRSARLTEISKQQQEQSGVDSVSPNLCRETSNPVSKTNNGCTIYMKISFFFFQLSCKEREKEAKSNEPMSVCLNVSGKEQMVWMWV